MIKICLFFLASISKNFIQFLPNGSRYLDQNKREFQATLLFQNLFFLMEVATRNRIHPRARSRDVLNVSTPFLPNGSRYLENVPGYAKSPTFEFQHLFFLMEVAMVLIVLKGMMPGMICFNTFFS